MYSKIIEEFETIEDVRLWACDEIKRVSDGFREEIAGRAHHLDSASWDRKERDAAAIIAGGEAPEYLQTEASEEGIEVLELAQIIQGKAETYLNATGVISGVSGAAKAEIRSGDSEQVVAILNGYRAMLREKLGLAPLV